MAVGISCASTGSRAAMQLLEPLQTDATDFVRQGALIASALVMLEQPESSGTDRLRRHLDTTIADKHEVTMAKMGAIMAQGILNAGGRNCSLSLCTRDAKTLRMSSVVGMAVFLQYW